MKRTVNMQNAMTVALPIALLVLSGALQATAQDDQSCPTASLKGCYGFQISGSYPVSSQSAALPEYSLMAR